MQRIIIFLLFFSLSVQALDDGRRKQILDIIDKEIYEVRRLSDQLRQRDPDLLLRQSELFLEKARLVKEVENERYLKLTPVQRRSVDKAKYFLTSNQYFSSADTLCRKIIQRHPDYEKLAFAYYILAYNEKEFGKDELAIQYFRKAKTSLGSTQDLRRRADVALAELYFNQDQCSKAIPLYMAHIKDQREKWWTKDAYNLGWCYYREKRYSHALHYMHQSFELSKNKKYIDMREDINQDIGLIYVDSDQTVNAIKFYQNQGIQTTDYMLELSQRLKDLGRDQDSLKVLQISESTTKDPNQKAQVMFERLELYNRYNQDSEHLKTIDRLMSLYKTNELNENQLKELKDQLLKKSSQWQKYVVSNSQNNITIAVQQRKKMANRYFSYLAQLDPSNQDQYSLLQGETSYSLKDYLESISYYEHSLKQAQKSNNQKVEMRAAEGMLSAAAELSKQNSISEVELEKVYRAYLSYDQKSPKAKEIYKKLFQIYFDQKKYAESEKVLNTFAKNYPQDYLTQEAMLAPLIDSYQVNQSTKLQDLIAKVQSGIYTTSPKFKQGINKVQLNKEVEIAQATLRSGNKERAIEEFQRVYLLNGIGGEARAKAAYNLSVLYYERLNHDQAYLWSKRALGLMSPPTLDQYAEGFIGISTLLFEVGDFEKSIDLSKQALVKLCKQGVKKNIFFRNGLYMSVAQKSFKEISQFITLANSCEVNANLQEESITEALDLLSENKNYSNIESLLELYKNKMKKTSALLPYWEELYKFYKNKNLGKANYMKNQMKYFEGMSGLSQREANALAFIEIEEASSLLDEIKKIPFQAPKSNFDQILEKKLNLLEKITNKTSSIKKLNSPKAIVEMNKIISLSYQTISKQLKDYAAQYQAEKNQLEEIIKPLDQEAANLIAQTQKLIEQGQILSPSNTYFYSSRYIEPVLPLASYLLGVRP